MAAAVRFFYCPGITFRGLRPQEWRRRLDGGESGAGADDCF